MQNWKIKNNTVMLDKFNESKGKVPTNRHRIPKVGDMNAFEEKKKAINTSPDAFIWDQDGRRHKKPKNQP